MGDLALLNQLTALIAIFALGIIVWQMFRLLKFFAKLVKQIPLSWSQLEEENKALKEDNAIQKAEMKRLMKENDRLSGNEDYSNSKAHH